jgi:hypothetical protein
MDTENEVVLDKPEVAEVADKPEPTLRETIENASKEVKENAEKEPRKPARVANREPKEAKQVDDKSVKEAVSAGKEQVKADVKPEVKSVAPPNSWTATAKAKWAELPPEIQAEVTKREQEAHREITRQDEERQMGKSVKDIVTPYMPMITAEGSTPQAAIKQLLNTAYLLRTASPQAKGQMILDMARQFGADLSQATQGQQQVDPQLRATQERLARLETERQNEIALREQQENTTLQTAIQEFASNPENAHYEQVKAHMASLLKGGMTKGANYSEHLADAYKQAVWAHSDIRSTLIESERNSVEAKLMADKKAKADAARKAAVSVTGHPGATAPANITNNNLGLREQLQAAYREHVN